MWRGRTYDQTKEQGAWSASDDVFLEKMINETQQTVFGEEVLLTRRVCEQ